MSGISLKTKYAGAAFGAVLAATLVVIALLAWQHRVDVSRIGALADASVREQVRGELKARADTAARHVADAAAGALRAGNDAALPRQLQRFQDDESVIEILIRDADQRVRYRGAREAAEPGRGGPSGAYPIRTFPAPPPGYPCPRTA